MSTRPIRVSIGPMTVPSAGPGICMRLDDLRPVCCGDRGSPVRQNFKVRAGDRIYLVVSRVRDAGAIRAQVPHTLTRVASEAIGDELGAHWQDWVWWWIEVES